MYKFLLKKKNGIGEEMIGTSFVVLTILIICVSFLGFFDVMNTKEYATNYMRSFVLKLQTDPTISTDVTVENLENLGLTDIVITYPPQNSSTEKTPISECTLTAKKGIISQNGLIQYTISCDIPFTYKVYDYEQTRTY